MRIKHPNFGALLLNYFGLKNHDNLKKILECVSFDSIINYLNAIFIKARTVPDEVDLMKVLFKMNIFKAHQLMQFLYKIQNLRK